MAVRLSLNMPSRRLIASSKPVSFRGAGTADCSHLRWGIQFEWHLPGRRLEIEIDEEGTMEYFTWTPVEE
jgi:hypothetical protein